MNSLVFDIRRYCIHDGPGIRTTVFFKGCPLRCSWCHNPESQEGGVEQIMMNRVLDGISFETKLAVGSWQLAVEVMKEIEKDEVFYGESGGGVTFSGGEPMMQSEALKELLELCRKKGYHTAVDTSGHADPAAVEQLMDLVDLWLFDLKLMNDARHLEYTGVSNEQSLKNLETLSQAGKNIIIRFPLIPGITGVKENLEAVAKLMKKLGLKRMDILPYHAIAKDKYKRMGKEYLLEGVEKPGKETIDKVLHFFIKNGIVANIGGSQL